MRSLHPAVSFALGRSFLFLLLASPPAFAQVGGTWVDIRSYPGAGANDRAGYSVANAGDLDGDGIADALVGAPFADPGGLLNAGSVYAWSGADGTLLWRFDGSAGDEAGRSVAAGDTDGDGLPEVIVGAPRADGSVIRSGAVFIVDGALGTLQSVIPGSQQYAIFGLSVASAGDLDGDGADDVVVGEPFSSTLLQLENAGTAYAYSGATGALLYQWEGPSAGWWFGNAVAGAGDTNGDGVPDVIVGATFADVVTLNDNSGAAAVFSGADGSLLLQFHGDDRTNMYGISVASAGDVDLDGRADILAGAYLVPFRRQGGVGAAYVRSGTGERLYRFPGTSRFERNGWSVANAGDVDGDGVPDSLSGAPSADSTARDAGRLYVHSGSDGQLLQTLEGGGPHFNFGWHLAGADDVDGDGRPEILVGAPGTSYPGLSQAGAAHLMRFQPCISASADSLSSAAGGTVTLDLDFPPSAAGRNYAMLASATGTGPVELGGVRVPLTADALYIDLIRSRPPAFLPSPYGILDASGDGSVVVDGAGGTLSAYVGTTLYFAAVSYGALEDVQYSSVAEAVAILP